LSNPSPTFSNPSYLSTTIKSWKKNRDLLVNHYNISKYNQGSDWMKYLLALGDTYQVDDYASVEEQEKLRIEESKRRINELYYLKSYLIKYHHY